MVKIIAGRTGKGKTKHMIEQANSAILQAHGNIVFLDRGSVPMYELNNRIRLINVREYPVKTTESFVGFLIGILSQDHDLEQIFIDNFIKIAALTSEEDITNTIETLNTIGNQFDTTITISLSKDADTLQEPLTSYVAMAL